MKYLFLTDDTYPPSRVDVSVLFGEELVALGHRVDWVMQSREPAARARTEAFGGGTAYVGASAKGDSALSKMRRKLQRTSHAFRLFRLAARGDYDFIQVKDRFLGGLIALLAARFNRRPFVFWLAYPFPESWLYDAKVGAARFPLGYRIRGMVSWVLLYRILLPAADLIFVQSRQMRADIAQQGIDAAKMRPVPMGVGNECVKSAEKGDRFELDGPLVCYVGTMIRVRRLEFLIDAFAEVLSSCGDAKLVMVGGESEEDRAALRRHADTLGIADRVVFTGWVSREEAWKWVQYLSQGTPVVANEHPEQTAVINESGGGIVTPYEVSAFAKGIVTLLQSPQMARSMGERGKQYVSQNRTYAVIARGVDEIYQRTFKTKRAALPASR
jgi:glycosyltransferase involved in cell wall biosynthesis